MPVLTGLQIDLDEIEDQVFAAEPHAPQRTYQLTREVDRVPPRRLTAA